METILIVLVGLVALLSPGAGGWVRVAMNANRWMQALGATWTPRLATRSGLIFFSSQDSQAAVDETCQQVAGGTSDVDLSPSVARPITPVADVGAQSSVDIYVSTASSRLCVLQHTEPLMWTPSHLIELAWSCLVSRSSVMCSCDIIVLFPWCDDVKPHPLCESQSRSERKDDSRANCSILALLLR